MIMMIIIVIVIRLTFKKKNKLKYGLHLLLYDNDNTENTTMKLRVYKKESKKQSLSVCASNVWSDQDPHLFHIHSPF